MRDDSFLQHAAEMAEVLVVVADSAENFRVGERKDVGHLFFRSITVRQVFREEFAAGFLFHCLIFVLNAFEAQSSAEQSHARLIRRHRIFRSHEDVERLFRKLFALLRDQLQVVTVPEPHPQECALSYRVFTGIEDFKRDFTDLFRSAERHGVFIPVRAFACPGVFFCPCVRIQGDFQCASDREPDAGDQCVIAGAWHRIGTFHEKSGFPRFGILPAP